ncbi:exported hypothetical protein [Candidatus Sulfopaludibacter sp. SbA4]|nr:exported hypothetical protein [Candidatus Sulfopaludibacter sp. SbA4]
MKVDWRVVALAAGAAAMAGWAASRPEEILFERRADDRSGGERDGRGGGHQWRRQTGHRFGRVLV